jgi:hypothetical protein
MMWSCQPVRGVQERIRRSWTSGQAAAGWLSLPAASSRRWKSQWLSLKVKSLIRRLGASSRIWPPSAATVVP